MININFSLINDNIKMEDAWRVEVANCGKQRDKDEWNGTRKEGRSGGRATSHCQQS